MESPRVLVVRLSALGDLVMASPLVGALRRAYPRAHIAWLAQPEHHPVLAAHPELDELIAYPRKRFGELAARGRWRALGGELAGFARALRGRGFDWALDPQGLAKSGVLARLSGAPRRVSVNPREGSDILFTETLASPADDPRVSSEYRALAEHLGLPTDDGFPMRVGVAREDAAWADDALRAAGIEGPFVAAAPFTTRPQKHWFASRWAQLFRRLADAGFPVVVLGGPGEAQAAERLAAAAHPAPVHAWAGRTTVGQALAVLDRAAGVAGVDTGLTHAAVARGRPTVALFGSTVPYTDPGPHAAARVLRQPLPCSPCHRSPICGGVFDCMRAIEVDHVLDALGDAMREEASKVQGPRSKVGTGAAVP